MKRNRKGHQFYVMRQKRLCCKVLRRRKKRKRRHAYVPFSQIHQPLSEKAYNEILVRAFPGYKHVKAPKNFSFIQNRDEVLSFLQQLDDCRNRRKKVLVRLDKVENLPTDAILLLLSTMIHFQVDKVEFNGTNPKDVNINLKLIDSGFFERLYKKSSKAKEEYSFRKINSYIYTHGQKTVSSTLADNLVKYASESVWGEPRRCQGIQKTLLELMHNTYDHAGMSKGDKHWWLSVEHDQVNKEVIFSFIDFGVGIFRSLRNKGPQEPLYGVWQKIIEKYPLATSQVEKLKLILEGQIQLSQTNDYYRGKGLAKIYNHYTNNKIASLCMVSNYAFINADKNEYVQLNNEFMGTFISFKIKENIVSLPWQI